MQVHQYGDLPDAGILYLGRPDAVRQPGFRQGSYDGRVGADPRVDDGDAVQDVGTIQVRRCLTVTRLGGPAIAGRRS